MTRRTRIGSRAASRGPRATDGIDVVHQHVGHRPASSSWLSDVAVALPALAAVGVLVAWSTDQGGYFARSWYPGALFLLAVLAVTVATDRGSVRALPRSTQIALAAFASFTAWTYLSITWADAKGAAWDGANLTLLYLIVFALCSRSLASERSLALVLGAWVAAITALAVVVLLELPAMLGGGPALVDPGLAQPFGYSNANAAIWLMALWPALMLAACRAIPPWLRGAAAGAIVVLAATSLLSDSRGALVATALVLLVAFAAVPDRGRTLLALLAPAVGIALTAPHVLDVAGAAARDPAAIGDLGSVAAPVLLAAVASGIALFAATTIAARRPASEAVARAARRVAAIVGASLVLAGVVAGLALVGDPIDRVERAWRDFKENPVTTSAGPGRPTAGVRGARYDYYRVSLDVFREHPVVGIGIDNFAQDYLARGTAGERPASPHSLELRMLLQTGVVGAALLLVALGAAFVAGGRALRSAGALGRATAAGGLLCCLYWIVHGSADWLWEFPALAGAAFAGLGLAGAAAPRRDVAAVVGAPRRSVAWLRASIVSVLVLVAAASFLLPWTADIELRRALVSWTVAPSAARSQLDLAAQLNPLSERPAIAAGTIAIRQGEVDRAQRAFEQALQRTPRSAYASLWLGAIASHRGQRASAERLLRRTLKLAPTDPVTLSVVAQARTSRIDLATLDRQLTDFANQLHR